MAAGGRTRSRLRSPWWIVGALVGVAATVDLWGARRDLPFPDVDERFFVHPAIHIASTGDLDPHWFGHPGSTVIYPLALLFHLWDALVHAGPLLWSSHELTRRFHESPGQYYLIGRLWTMVLALGAIPLLFALGRRVFGTRAALAACALWVVLPLVIQYSRIVRTDTAAIFFGLLALLAILMARDHPTTRRCVLAGASVGLAISSRYFMATLVPVLVAAVVIPPSAARGWATVRRALLGTGAAIGTFLLTTPYFVLDLAAVSHSLAREDARSPGRDDLSWLGNIRWYLGRVLPLTLTSWVTVLVVVGIALALWRRNQAALLLLGFATVFLVVIATSEIHWERWILPVLPVFVLFAAAALDAAVMAVTSSWPHSPAWQAGLVAAVVVVLAITPIQRAVSLNELASRPSTRVVARRWMKHHLDLGSRVGIELKTAPLRASGFRVTERYSLGQRPLEHYEERGYRYLVTNGQIRHALVNEGRRYPEESSFYRSLNDGECRLHEFRPSRRRAGPVITVWELTAKGDGACHRAVDAAEATRGRRQRRLCRLPSQEHEPARATRGIRGSAAPAPAR